jgi:hypothetical protein
MPVVDDRQPRPDFDNPSSHDRKSSEDRSRPLRVRPDHYERHGKKHYEKNKAHYIAKAAERRKKYQQAWTEYKSKLSCQHCGENHPATFDFHHVTRGPENVKIFQLIKNGSYKKVYEELKKCIVLCANCHRKLHYEEAQAKKDPD